MDIWVIVIPLLAVIPPSILLGILLGKAIGGTLADIYNSRR